jgi:hypothetical protein
MAALMIAAPLRAEGLLQDSLTLRLRAMARPIELSATGELTGGGGEFLRAAVRVSRFTMVAEEHGIVEVPKLSEALWKEAQRAGYSHFAIETGEQLAVRLENALRADRDDTAYLTFLRRHWPGAPFFAWREDAALLRAVVNSTPGQRGVLWGLDYDIVADRHALGRLRELAPDPNARRVADSAIAVADSALDRGMRQQNPGLITMFGGDSALFSRLRTAYQPRAGSEADRILTLMDSTLYINRLFLGGKGYESNLSRSRLLKRQFWRFYDSTRAASGREPKVLLKFGASHLQRGPNFTNTYDLGSLLPELAEKDGGEGLSIYVVGGPGTQRAQIDPRSMTSTPVPVQALAPAWMKPFADAADPEHWTLYDLRALRSMGTRRLAALAPQVREIILGFDAMVVLSGSTPQHDLITARP